MKISIRLLAAMVALACGQPAYAKAPVFVTWKPVADKPTVALDGTRAYVMLRTTARTALLLMKEPSAEDQVAYDKLRSEALAKAHAKYVKKRAAYEQAKANAARTKNNAIVVPDEPVEPTEQNFDFTPFGTMATVNLGPLFRFSKESGDRSTYLTALTPGSYRVYGPLSLVPGQPPVGSCFCMGSVRFEVKAGEIVDLGELAGAGLFEAVPDFESLAVDAAHIVPATSEMPVDARLAGQKIVPAQYRPAGKLPNYYGVSIDRLAAIPGVMRYERDNIVDLTAAN